MLKTSVLFLVIQIGFNTALNSGSSNTDPRPFTRSMKLDQFRRSSNSNRYQSEKSMSSERDLSDSEEYSSEETIYRIQHPLRNLPYQKNHSDLRYSTRTTNIESLEMPPVGRLGPNVDNYQSDFLTSRIDTGFKTQHTTHKPVLRHNPLNTRLAQNSDYRKKRENLLREMPYRSRPDKGLASAAAGKDTNDLYPLLSQIEQPNLRRDQNRKNNKVLANLRMDVLPIDTQELDDDSEPTLNSYLELPNYRRKQINVDKPRISKKTRLRSDRKAITKKNKINNRRFDDTFEISSDEMNFDNDYGYFPRKLKRNSKNKKMANNLRASRKYKRNNAHNVALDSLSNDIFMNSDKDDLNKWLVLSSPSRDSLQLRTRQQKQEKNKHQNRSFLRLVTSQNDKFSLDEDVALGLSQLISENIDNLKIVPSLRNTKVPLWKNTRRTVDDRKLKNEKIQSLLNDKENNDDSSENLAMVLPLMNRRKLDDNLNANMPILRSTSTADFRQESSGLNISKHKPFQITKFPWNNGLIKQDVKQSNTFSTINSSELKLRSRDLIHNQNNLPKDERKFECSNCDSGKVSNFETNLRERDQVYVLNELHFDFPWCHQPNPDHKNGKLTKYPDTKLRLGNQDKIGGLNKDPKKYELKLEFPWTDQPSPYGQSGKLTVYSSTKSRLRNQDKVGGIHKNPKNYELKLEFPWTDQPNPDETRDKITKYPGTKSRLRNQEKIEKLSYTKNYELQLEYPWNNQPNPDEKSSKLTKHPNTKSRLRNQDKIDKLNKDPKNYELKLEFPWTDQPSPDDKSGKLIKHPSTKSRLRNQDKIDKLNKDPKNYELNLEFPWNDQPSPDDKSGKLTKHPSTKSRLRNQDKTNKSNKDPKNYELNLEFPWNDQPSPDDKSGKLTEHPSTKSRLRNQDKTDNPNKDPKNYDLKLEFPWTDQPSPDNKSGKLTKHPSTKLGLRNHTKIGRLIEDLKDYELRLEYPWTNEPNPDDESKFSYGRTIKSRLRNRDKTAKRNKETKDELNLEFPWNGELTPDKNREDNNPNNLGINKINKTNYRRFNEDPSLHILPIIRGGVNGNSDDPNSEDDPISSITLPIDRRPHLRFRKLPGAYQSPGLRPNN